MIQLLNLKGMFSCLPTDYENMHIINFMQSCTSYNLPRLSLKAIQLRLFTFTLIGKATIWLDEIPHGSITTGNELRTQLLDQFVFPSKIWQLSDEIYNFRQSHLEALCETWLSFKKKIWSVKL